MDRNSAVKLVTVSIVGIILLYVISTILTGSGAGYGMNVSGNIMGYHYRGGVQMGNGALYSGSGVYLLSILIKILFAIFVLGLVGGLIVWIKDYLFTAEDKLKLRQALTINKRPTNITVCSICGKEQSSEWKVCPYCGKEADAQIVK